MKIFCSGIGGIGLSAYAGHMIARGHTVTGSDKAPSIITDDIREKGATLSFIQDGSAVNEDCDLFVYSEAIPESSPERTRAKELGIRQISYFQAVGELTKGGKVICVAGTHGKSSTTAMVAKVLVEAGVDPNVIVGTRMKDIGNTNWRASTKNLWVVEACEYRKSFHYLSPSIILLTTVDGDHFDAYRDIDDYRKAFVEFCALLPSDGTVILHGNDADAVGIAKSAEKKIIDADALEEVSLTVPGLHMRANAKLALALAHMLHIDTTQARKSLMSFSGTWRRMDIRGVTQEGALVIDDYGHHPVEVSATLSAIREAYPKKRIICVYQPHTHDRTLKLLKEFSTSFTDADLLIVPNIYDARPEKDAKKASVEEFLSVTEKGSTVRTINGINLKETERIVHECVLSANDVVVTMGAGDITTLSKTLAKKPYLR